VRGVGGDFLLNQAGQAVKAVVAVGGPGVQAVRRVKAVDVRRVFHGPSSLRSGLTSYRLTASPLSPRAPHLPTLPNLPNPATDRP